MTAKATVQRRPPLRDRDVELATALGSCPTLLLWRTRLPTIRVERVRRCVRGRGFLPNTWWDVALVADDGWRVQGEILDVEPLMDVERIHDELAIAERATVSGGRIRRLVRWLLWDELCLARDRLDSRLMDPEWVEVT